MDIKELLKKYNDIWNKVSITIMILFIYNNIEFDSETIYNKKF